MKAKAISEMIREANAEADQTVLTLADSLIHVETDAEGQAVLIKRTPSAIRQAWLERATEMLRPTFKQHGTEIPETLRVSIGTPWGTRKAIGQCWHSTASSDGHREVFVSPMLGDADHILATLAHELVHASLPDKTKHGPAFAKLAKAIGLEGKMTATVAGDRFKETIETIKEEIGEYPGGSLDPSQNGAKKQTTRMLKVECEECGYVARTSRKWIEQMGAPYCADPDHGPMKIEGEA
jgi:hypothetical protein